MGRFPGRAEPGPPNIKIPSPIGIMLLSRNTLWSFFGFRNSRLYGAEIIFPCRHPEILLSGKN
jgi:hypothetical protein